MIEVMEQWQIDRYNKYITHLAERVAFHHNRIYELLSDYLELPDVKERIAWHESRIKVLRETSRQCTEDLQQKLANN